MKELLFEVEKSNKDERLVFGWANVAALSNGEPVVDSQEDSIDISELESAAYEFVLRYRSGGEMHEREDVGTLVESIVFTEEKAKKLGLPPGALPHGWWVGFKINDEQVWEKIKNGTYSMFSIGGTALREG